MESPAPTAVYLDTNVLVNCFFPESPQSQACLQAGQALNDAGSVVYIVRMEYAQAFRTLATQRQLSSQIYNEFDLKNWQNMHVRLRWMQYWQHHLEALIASFPRVVELPLFLSVLQAGVDLMGRYALHSQDAVHLSSALRYEIPVFWTCDCHFSRVDEIVVEIIRDQG